MHLRICYLLALPILLQTYLVSAGPIEHNEKDDFEELKVELLSKLAEKMPPSFKYSSAELKDGLNVLLATEMETTDNDFEEIALLPDLSAAKVEEYKSILSMLKRETSLEDKSIGKLKFWMFGLENMPEAFLFDFYDNFRNDIPTTTESNHFER